jgi:UDP-N-acetylmuramoyl-L-alanyl-D-glutamate--2,6-diaminopimelate ligase
VLSTLKPLVKSRLIVVFGCGGDRDKTKRPRMARAAQKYGDIVIVTSDNPRTEDANVIIRDITAGFETHGDAQITVEPDREKAIALAIGEAAAGDVVVIAGKGHEDYQILGRKKIHFSDKEVALKYLKQKT